jgi:AbrB family looped-hinge helix DNA binding protein
MEGSLATITAKGQVTIPAEIRKALGLKPGNKVSFVLEQGEVKLEPSSSPLRAGFGAVKPRKKPEDFKELRGEVQGRIAQKAVEEL